MSILNGKPFTDTSHALECILSMYVLMGWAEDEIRKEFELILEKVLLNKDKI